MYSSLAGYLQTNFGQYMDESTFRTLYADQVLAESYRNHYQNGLTYTDEELESYYSEHSNELDTFQFSVFNVRASVEEQTDEEGNTVEMTDEEIQAALDASKETSLALAQEIQNRLANGEDAQTLADEYGDQVNNTIIHTTQMGSNFSGAQYADWVYEAGRQSGDVTSIEYDSSCSASKHSRGMPTIKARGSRSSSPDRPRRLHRAPRSFFTSTISREENRALHRNLRSLFPGELFRSLGSCLFIPCPLLSGTAL